MGIGLVAFMRRSVISFTVGFLVSVSGVRCIRDGRKERVAKVSFHEIQVVFLALLRMERGRFHLHLSF